MRRVASRDGYAATTIAQVIAIAGVSRPTFYEYFPGKEQCFLAALSDTYTQLHAAVAEAVDAAPPAQALGAAINALLAFAACRRDDARLLMSEAMAAGPRVLDAREEALAEIAEIIEQAQLALPPSAVTPDIPSHVLLGSIYRLLARRLREDQDMTGLSADLLQWIKSYERPIAGHRWRELEALPAPVPWPVLPETQLREPAPAPRGRRANGTRSAENQRERVLFAAATLAQSKGFAATTIAEISQRAGVNRRAFNALFAGKQDAFQAVIALGFQRTIAVTAGAFFTGATWPERIWEAGRAFTEFFQRSPAVAHIGFVEPYAIGPAAAQQVEDSVNAFTLFLHDGVGHAHNAAPTASPLALQAIATSIFETAYLEKQAQRRQQHVRPAAPHDIPVPCAGHRSGRGERVHRREVETRELGAE